MDLRNGTFLWQFRHVLLLWFVNNDDQYKEASKGIRRLTFYRIAYGLTLAASLSACGVPTTNSVTLTNIRDTTRPKPFQTVTASTKASTQAETQADLSANVNT